MMKNYDPSTATATDKVFVATMLKTIISDERVKKGMPNSVADYLDYIVNKMVENINAEVTLDIIKTMGIHPTEDNDDEQF